MMHNQSAMQKQSKHGRSARAQSAESKKSEFSLLLMPQTIFMTKLLLSFFAGHGDGALPTLEESMKMLNDWAQQPKVPDIRISSNKRYASQDDMAH
jgi:hypothetical protein